MECKNGVECVRNAWWRRCSDVSAGRRNAVEGAGTIVFVKLYGWREHGLITRVVVYGQRV